MNRDEEEFSDEEESGTFDGRPPPQDADRDFDDDFERSDGGAGEAVVQNQPFDEAVELSDHGSEQPSPVLNASKGGGRAGSTPSYAPPPPPPGSVQNRPHDEEFDVESEASVNDDAEEESPVGSRPAAKTMQPEREEPPRYERRPEAPTLKTMDAQPQMGEMLIESPTGGLMGGSVHRDFGSMGSPGGEEEEQGAGGPVPEGMYDASAYAGLDVTPEIAELFQYIGRYKPHAIELETKMRPFVAEYIPAVGEIDPFVKVPRPDAKPDHLGLTVLDETAATQSDPTVLTLQLKAVSKYSGVANMAAKVKSVEGADKTPAQINKWIGSIKELHTRKPAPSVRYTKPMPDIEALMQIWPAKFEELLDTVRLPDAELSLELADLVRSMCAILDIPVYSSLTESLHVLFTLYSDFKANVHFQQQLDGMPAAGSAADADVWGPM